MKRGPRKRVGRRLGFRVPPGGTGQRNRSGTIGISRHHVIVALIAAACFAATACDLASALGWSRAPAYGFTIDTNSLGPSLAYPGASAVWVLFQPTQSVECSPPRGCYAAMQHVAFTFNCAPRYAVMTDRISYDLNGNVVKRENQNIQSVDPLTYDAGARLVVDTYCPLYSRGQPPPQLR